jgi:hypothetical protein
MGECDWQQAERGRPKSMTGWEIVLRQQSRPTGLEFLNVRRTFKTVPPGCVIAGVPTER